MAAKVTIISEISANCKIFCTFAPMMYRIIVLDLDGTLTNSEKKITPKTKAALMQAQEQGARIVLASGRPTYGIVPIAEELQLDKYEGYIMAFNGGKITDWTTKDTIFEQKLDDELVPLLYHEAMYADMNILTYRGESILSSDKTDKYVLEEARINKMPVIEPHNFLDAVEYPVNKCLIVGDPEPLHQLELKVAEKMQDRISVYTSAPFFMECVPLNIDKAASLDRLLKILKVSKDEVIACGDGHNDMSMIQYAGLGVAMANAEEDVKAAADYITLSNEEDGVGEVVEKFMLRNSRD